MAFDKPRGPRKTFGDKPSYGPRKSYGDKPAFGERKPYGPRKEYGAAAGGDKPSYGERKPYAPRAEGQYAGASDRPRRPYGDKPAFGERKPYGDRPQRSYAPRAEGDAERPRRPYGDKPAYSGERKSYGPRKDFGDRPARPYGDRPARPYTPRAPRAEGSEGGSFERPAREWGDAKQPRFNERPNRKAQFETKVRNADATVLANGDGWLVGHHAVLAALKNGRRKVREVWLLADATGELATTLAANPEWPVNIKAREDFNRDFGEAVHQGVAALVGNLQQPSLPELLATKPQLLVALDQVTDPHNLGAIVRSCAAFGAKGVLVTEHRAAGVNATAAKAAAGALESVPVAEITNLASALKMLNESGYAIIGLAGESEVELGTVIAKIKADQPVCLVVGSEGEGLRRLTRENCDHLAKINITSAVESLNVSVATGVALALLARR